MTKPDISAALFACALALPSIAFAQPQFIQPGKWEMASTVNTVDMPTAPPNIAAMMRGKTTTMEHCITPEEASRGPQSAMKSNKACSFPRYSMSGGVLKSTMVCQQRAGTMTVESSGTYTPTSFRTSSRAVATGGMAMTMTSTTIGRRVGDCR